MTEPFPLRLRAATRDAHTAGERAFAPFLRDPAGAMDRFLVAQRAAHEALLGHRATSAAGGIAAAESLVGPSHTIRPAGARAIGPNGLPGSDLPPLAGTDLAYGEILARLRADCAGLAPLALPPALVRGARALHDLAVAYLVFGSRKGASVMRTLLLRTGVPVPAHLAPDAEHGADHDGLWTRTLARLEAVPPTGPLARVLVRDTGFGFHLFREAALRAFPPTDTRIPR